MSSPTLPNIVVIMADQLMPFLTGAYGHSVVRTPNLDRLAERGCGSMPPTHRIRCARRPGQH